MEVKRFFRILTVFVSAVFFMATSLSGQAVNNAQIHGFVADSSGAAVANATVNATQTATGIARSATTGADGSYLLSDLPVGAYELQVSAPGFSTYHQTGILLQVGQNPEINPKLKVGSVNATVEVSADAAMVETHDTQVSEVIDQQRIVNLPLNGRNAAQLIILSGAAAGTPTGAVPAGNDLLGSKNYGNGLNTGSGSSQLISVAGGQVNGTDYLLDGGDNNDAFSNVNLPFPFPDALQEFSVQTSTQSAQYGVHAGGTVNIVTKSGTNRFHGDGFEFLRNYAVNAKNFFFNPQSPDTLKRNQFGGTLGGPIVRDKLFFFLGYQGTRNRSVPPTASVQIPTAAMLAGDFSVRESTACLKKAITLKDPTSGSTFAGNQVPAAMFQPQAVKLITSYMTALEPFADQCGNVSVSIPRTGDEDQGIGRVDWSVTPRNAFFGRYFASDFRDPRTFNPADILTTNTAGQLSRDQSVTLGETYTISSNTINSVRLTGTRLAIGRGNVPGMINPQTLGVTSNGGNFPIGVPDALVLAVTSGFTVQSGTSAPGHFNNNALQAADDVTMVRGRHSMSFGVDWIRYQLNELSQFQSDGQFSFDGSVTGDGLADFLLGYVGKNGFVQGNPERENWTQDYMGLYFQDDISLRRNLTVKLGVRWDPYLPATDARHRGSVFSLPAFLASGTSLAAQTTKVFPGTPPNSAPPGLFYCGDAQVSCSYIKSHLANFSPRVGLAWDPTGSGKLSIRAGYGIFYDNPEVFYFDRFADNSPFGSAEQFTPKLTFNGHTAPADGGFGNPYLGLGTPPFPQAFPTSSTAFYPASGSVFINVPPNLSPTYVQQWNLSVQKQVGRDWLFSISYLGNKTTHMWLGYESNPTDPVTGLRVLDEASLQFTGSAFPAGPVKDGLPFGDVTQTTDAGNAWYDGLLLSANHRFNQHFTVLANYAWSHCAGEGDFGGELTNSRQLGEAVPYVNPNGTPLLDTTVSQALLADRGNCSFAPHNLFNTSFLATSPTFGSGFVRHLTGGWGLSGIVTADSGTYLNPNWGQDNSGTGIQKNDQRPSLTGNPNNGPRTAAQWFNTGVFVQNAKGTYGNAPRDAIEGPSFADFDVAVTREFPIHESQRLELRFEAFNVLNHANFNPSGVDVAIKDSTFGQLKTAFDPRILQAALKYTF